MSESMDPALASYWTTMDPVTCNGCEALAKAHDRDKDHPHPQTLRHVVGMREGWEDAPR